MATKNTKQLVPAKQDKSKGYLALVRTVTFIPKSIVATDGCLDMEDAIALVESSIGGGPHNLSTKLKELFPSSDARKLVCQRLTDAAVLAKCTIPAGGLPCGGNSSLGNIVDTLTC